MAYSDYEIETNPELQRTEINPTVKNVMCKHDVIYKTLATVGDFYCRIWYYNDNYDPVGAFSTMRSVRLSVGILF